MNYIQIGVKKLITDKIVSVFRRDEKAIAIDTTGTEHVLKEGTENQLDSYIKGLMTALNITSLPEIVYHWFDLNADYSDVTIGTALKPDVHYDGANLADSGFTYASTQEGVVKFINGKMLILKNGTSEITISKDGDSIKFTVTANTNNNTGLFKSADNVVQGKTMTMKLIELGADVPNKNAVWNSYDKSKATVDENGVVTGVANGETYIEATYKGISYIKHMVVHPTAPAPEEEQKTIKVDETFKGTMPSKAGFSGAEWSSADPEIATVDSQGNVTAKKVGTVDITGKFTTPYHTPGKIYKLTIQPKAPAVQQKTATVKVGGATVQGEMPTAEGFSGAKWVSANPDKATVDQNTGVITAVAQGQATVTGKFTTPYETNAVVYTVTVQPADSQP